MQSRFINDHLNAAFADDAKLSSHPVEVACPNANDINQVCQFGIVDELL